MASKVNTLPTNKAPADLYCRPPCRRDAVRLGAAQRRYDALQGQPAAPTSAVKLGALLPYVALAAALAAAAIVLLPTAGAAAAVLLLLPLTPLCCS